MKPQFKQFLKSKKLYWKFFKNCLLQSDSNIISNFQTFQITLKHGWLWSAFTWDETPQGYKFWKDVSEKWNKIQQMEIQ